MGKVKTVVLLLLSFLLPTLVSPRHFNCANVCEQAGRGHPDRPSGTEVGFNVLNSSPFLFTNKRKHFKVVTLFHFKCCTLILLLPSLTSQNLKPWKVLTVTNAQTSTEVEHGEYKCFGTFCAVLTADYNRLIVPK